MSDAPISPEAAVAGTDADPFLRARNPGPNASPAERQAYETMVAKYRADVAGLHAKHGLPALPEPMTREGMAIAEHDRSTGEFLDRLINGAPGDSQNAPTAGIMQTVEGELQRVETLDQDGQRNAVAAVKAQLGDQYDSVVAAAKLAAGADWSNSMLGSAYVLKTMASIAH